MYKNGEPVGFPDDDEKLDGFIGNDLERRVDENFRLFLVILILHLQQILVLTPNK